MSRVGRVGAWLELPARLPERVARQAEPDPAPLCKLPPPGSRDRKLWRRALQHEPRGFARAPEWVRDDLELARLAVLGDGEAFAHCSQRLRGDKALALLAVERMPENLLHVVGLRHDPDVALATVRQHGAMLALIHDETPRYRDIVRAGLQHYGRALEFTDLIDDEELVQVAVTSDGLALGHASERLRDHRELALLAVQENGLALEYASPRLQADPELVHLAVIQDREALLHAAPSLLGDVAFLHACAERDPLCVNAMPETSRALLRAAYPEHEARARDVQQRLAALRLPYLAARLSGPALQQLLAARETPDATDGRPLAVVIYPTADENRAFTYNELAEMARHYRVLYYEVSTNHDLVNAWLEATAAQAAELVVLAGHGVKDRLALGAPNPAEEERWAPQFYLDLASVTRLGDFAARLAPGAPVVLKSCSTGEGREGADNLANGLAQAWPHATVHAPTQPTNNRIRFAAGRFADAGYRRGPLETFVVSAAAGPRAAPPASSPRW